MNARDEVAELGSLLRSRFPIILIESHEEPSTDFLASSSVTAIATGGPPPSGAGHACFRRKCCSGTG